ncbi:YadA-like family protein [Rodentibacter sp. Ppn85]|uniref:YadA-like family protein n=1 Tax=Rodentibacter sp. Ppn85 TaxID=1908525 RepID=UPI000987A462|nr:YadA-like family protein [Rodentibacter sp. Ppn85]OOF65402.1 hypothetical protein BKL51_05880 [Rodentibacter sp. Ppn85]
MNKIFKVIWNHAAQTWTAVSELSKVKAISSTLNKPDSLSANLIKTIAITLPFVATPFVANAYIEMGGTASPGQFTTPSAKANPGRGGSSTWAYDYKNPGNKSYHDADKSGNLSNGYSNTGEYAFGIAIGNQTNAIYKDGSSNGIAMGDYAKATGGLATAIGAFSNAEDTGSTAIGTASRAKGFNSLAMMRQSAAIGDYSAAIGSVAYAKGNASFAFGASATSNGNQSIAIGNTAPKTLDGLPGTGEAKRTKYDGLSNTQSNGDRSVAIGSGAKTNGNDSFAFGSLASTGEFYSTHDNYLGEQVTKPSSSSAEKAIAFGTSSRATGNSSIAFGYNSLAAKINSIAFGVEAKAHKNDAVAFGSNANASEANAIAFGTNAQALHENVITIGKNSKATKKGAMSIGEGAISNANNSLSLGNGTVVNQEDIKNENAKYTNDGFGIERGVVAIANKGVERRLVNLAAGREDTDAVNVKQLSEVNDNLAKSIAGDGYIGYSIDSATGRYTYKAPEFDIKNQKLNNVKKAVELAQTNYVSVNADKNKQKEANSNYDNLGAKGTGSIALGEMTGTAVSAKETIAIGHNTNVIGANTIAIGANINAGTAGSVVLGDNSTTTGSHATETVASKTIGGHTYTFTGTVQDAGRFVSIGEKGKERQIKNVAAGHVEVNSTDAINGSQLHAVASRIEQGWKVATDKTGTGEVTGNKEQKIAMGDTVKVIAGNNINITQNNADLTIATKENVTFTKVTTSNTTLDDKGLTIKDGPKMTKDGIDASNKKITNVLNGTIDANSQDAVNGSQLFATNQNVTNNANNIANNTQNISKNTNDIIKGLNFQGDNTGVTVNRKLGETLNVTGGAAENNLSDNNIGVVGTASGSLAIKLAKDLKELNSVNTKEIKLGDQTSNTTIKYDGDRIKYGDRSIANLGDEKHITKGEYAVQNDGSVTMTYTDGNGKLVTNETAKITGIAKQDLSNINNGGETKIKNLAKATINMEDGKNTKVSYRDVNDVKTFKVDVEGALANITSITNGNGSGKVEFGADGVVNISGNNSISLNGKDGHITGLTNTDWNVTNPTPVSGRAATEDQLKTVSNVVNTKIGDNGIKLSGNSGTTNEQKLSKSGGLQFNVVGGDSAKYVATTAAGADITVDLTKDTKDKIDNASDKNLNNITNEGKKVITGLGTIVEAGNNVVVTNTTDATTGQKTYTVSAIAQNLGDAELSYKANGENPQKVKVSQGLDFTDGNYTTVTVAENGKVQYDVNVGNITTRADGKAGIDGANGKNTVATVKTVVEAINNSGWLANATKSAGGLDGTSVATKVAPSAVVNFDAGKNLTVKQDVTDPNNQTYTYSLANDITIGEKGESGIPGKDGIDGKIGINGKDGSAVVINGKDGSIGLNGTNGSNGLTIRGDKGAVGVDGTDGANGKDGMTRIVYKDDKGTNHTVATLEDGLRFTGNNESVENKHKLNTLVKVQGEGVSETTAKTFESAAGNINVVADGNNKLEVKLNKDINLTDKGSVKVGNTTVNNSGIIITNPTDTAKTVSLTNSGLNNGGNQIKNVANGTNSTDAVNLSQLDSVKSAERHIKPGEYKVDDAGTVTMRYVDGDGKDAAGEAKITNIAKSDLKNITNDGKKVVTGLGTIVQSGSKNVTVTPNEDQTTGQKTYTVSVAEQNLGDVPLTYKANGSNDQTVTLSKGLNFTDGDYTTASIGKDGIVKYDVKLGATPTTPINGKNGKDGADGIATVHQVIDIVNNSGWNANATGNVNGSSVAKTVRAGAVVNLDAGKNLTVTQSSTDEAQTYSFALNKDLTNLDKIVVNGTNGVNSKDGVTITGPNGQNGEDGKVGISGKDGKDAVSISAKDGVGHIGLTGPKGADGSDGVSADISVKEGKAGVDGEDGKDGITRIVYKDKDGKEHEVATHDDGMKYYGDAIANTNVIKKHLNEQVNIIGGITDRNELSEENNIGVISDGSNNLTVRLAKNLNGINSVGGNNSSIVFTGKDNNDPSQPAVTIKGGDVSIDGNKITNLKDGDVNPTSKEAVNGSQLYNVTNAINTKGLDFGTQSVGNDSVIHKNLGEKLEIVGKGEKSDTEYDATNIKTITENGKVVVALAKDLTANKVTVGEKGANGKDGVDGTIGVNGKDGSSVVINGKDGSIGLNGKDGANGLTIKGTDGKAGVDGKDGESKTRIVYETKDPKDSNKTIIEEVATLNDGLKFKGDKGDAIAKKLNEELAILGKLNANADVTDKNLRVDNESGKLILKMAKALQDLTSAQFIDEITSSKSVINGNGLTITPKDDPVNKTVSVTDKGLNNGGNQIVNVDSGLKDANGNKVSLTDAKGDTLNNAVNVGDLKESINNITDPSKGGGFGLTDENGNDAKAKLGETVTVKGDGSVTTKVVNENGKAKLQVGLNKDVTIGNNQESGAITVKGENGQDGVSINGKDGSIGLKGADGKDAITLSGKDGTIGINGKDGSTGEITVVQGQAGLDGNDGKDSKTKTRIVYEKPNGETEEVATLNDGLRFTGNNEVVNSHKLNSVVTIKGEGIDKDTSENFKSAEGNINVKADGKGTLEVQLAKDLKNVDSISNKDGQKIEFKAGGTTISGGNLSVDDNKITNVKAGEYDTDAVNVKQLKDGIAQATTTVNAGKNIDVIPTKNADGSTTYTVKTKDNVDFTSVTTGNTTMNDSGITIRASDNGKTNVILTNKGLDNGGNKVVNVADGEISSTSKDAVNGSQLHNVKQELAREGLNFKGQSGQSIHKNLGETLEIVGKGDKADTEYDAANIKTYEENGKVVVALAKDLTANKVTVGEKGANGKDGADGSIGVNGKDGSSVVINGKDGSIGLNGKDGKNGISIKGQDGKVGVDGKDGETRLVYVEKDNPNKTHEIATTDDGLKFTGNNEVVNSRKLNNKVTVKGEGVSKSQSENFKSAKGNINVKADGKDTLEVQLAKDIELGNDGSVRAGNTVVNNRGVSVKNGPSITQDGIDAGNKRITNIAPGVKDTDAVNVNQLKGETMNIRSDMNRLDKNLRAGIAGAIATGGLYHATLPGKSMVSAGVGTYKGEGAISVSYSRLSDNGKVGIKFSVNTNSRGDFGSAASMGYQW